MGKVKVEINPQGIIELFKSDGMQDYLQDVGNAVAEAATGRSGEEYGARSHLASYTAICNVYPASPEAAKDNLENNTLLYATGSLGLPKEKPTLK